MKKHIYADFELLKGICKEIGLEFGGTDHGPIWQYHPSPQKRRRLFVTPLSNKKNMYFSQSLYT